MFEGIACRHELCAYIKGSKSLKNLNIHKRWSKEYFDITKLPRVEEVEESKLEELPPNNEGDQTKKKVVKGKAARKSVKFSIFYGIIFRFKTQTELLAEEDPQR